MKLRITTLLFCFLFLTSCLSPEDAAKKFHHVYLTYDNSDTAHSIVFNVHTTHDVEDVRVILRPLAPAPLESTKMDESEVIEQDVKSFVDISSIKRRIHRLSFNHLTSGMRYGYQVFVNGLLFDSGKYFETISENAQEIRFVTGGDTNIDSEVIGFNKIAAQNNAQFVFMGGDIAFDEGNPLYFERWDEWLSMWSNFATSSEGKTLPLVFAVGDKEVSKSSRDSDEQAPFFFRYFDQGGKSFFKLQFGKLLGLLVLDTDHVESYKGEQEDFIMKTMTDFESMPYTVALYHRALYPSVSDYKDSPASNLREHWQQIFDKFDLSFAFENHEQALKRTHPIKNNQVVAEGTVYLGDGAWGKTTKKPNGKLWYLAQAIQASHLWAVTLIPEQANLKAIAADGQILDETVIGPRER